MSESLVQLLAVAAGIALIGAIAGYIVGLREGWCALSSHLDAAEARADAARRDFEKLAAETRFHGRQPDAGEARDG